MSVSHSFPRSSSRIARSSVFVRLAAIALGLGVFCGAPKAAHASGDPRVEKLNTIVDFFNHDASYQSRAVHEYFDQVDPKAGPVCPNDDAAKRLNNTRVRHGARDKELDALRDASQAEPAVAKLDSAAKDLADSTDQLRTVLKDVSSYYEGGEHLKDGCKKGKALHVKVKSSAARFFKAKEAVYKWLREDTAKRSQSELKSAEKKYGKSFVYWKIKTMIDTRALVDALETDAASGKPNATACLAAIGKYKTTGAALDAFEKKNHTKADEHGFTSFALYAGHVEHAAQRYAEGLKEGRPVDLKELVGSFNSLVDKANGLTFGEDFH